MSSKRMKSILETVYETALGLYEAGLMNEKKLQEFREICKIKEGEPTRE